MVWARRRKFDYRRIMQFIKFVSEEKNKLYFVFPLQPQVFNTQNIFKISPWQLQFES